MLPVTYWFYCAAFGCRCHVCHVMQYLNFVEFRSSKLICYGVLLPRIAIFNAVDVLLWYVFWANYEIKTNRSGGTLFQQAEEICKKKNIFGKDFLLTTALTTTQKRNAIDKITFQTRQFLSETPWWSDKSSYRVKPFDVQGCSDICPSLCTRR